MAEFKKTTAQIKQEIGADDFLAESRKQRSDEKPYLFLSIDLVNSTALKNTSKWISVLSHLFEAATDYAKANEFKIWKYRGDEALFFKELFSDNYLRDELSQAYEIVRRLNNDFANEYPTPPSPQVKATMWISVARNLPRGALVSTIPEIEEIEANKGSVIITMSDEATSQPVFEFLGLSIDAGFRISETAHPHTITISLQLAHLSLTARKGRRPSIRVAGYQKLRGVSDKPYPILWFAPEWSDFDNYVSDNSRIRTEHELVAFDLKHILKTRDSENLIEQHELSNEINHLSETLEKNQRHPLENEVIEGSPITSKQAEVHCVAICFNPSNEVLLGKRREKSGSSLSNKWEFGCAQLHQGQTFIEAISRDYKHDFGIEVTDICPHPVTTFSIPDKDMVGIIFVASVSSNDAPQNNKHAEAIWSSPAMITFKNSECVPDFHDTLQRAVSIHNDWKQ